MQGVFKGADEDTGTKAQRIKWGADEKSQRQEYKGGKQGQGHSEGLGVLIGSAGRGAGKRVSRAGDSPRRS